MQTQLYAAIEESIVQGTLERTLRLLIQNIPRFPTDSQLRRHVINVVAAEGLLGETVPVLQRVVEIDAAQGRIVGLIATARLAEGLGLPSDDAWHGVESLVSRRPSSPQAIEETNTTEAELTPIRPMLGRDGLLHVAVEMAARPVEGLAERPVVHLPLVGQLKDDDALAVLRDLRLSIAPPNTAIVHTNDTVAWLVLGAFADGSQQAEWLPEGTLLTAETPVTATTAWTLASEKSAWQRLCAQPEVGTALKGILQTAQAVAVIGRSAFTRAVGAPALHDFLTHALAFTAPSGIIRPWGEPSGGIGMLVQGALHMNLRRDGNLIHVGTLQPGDTFGAETGDAADVALLELKSPVPVRWIWLPEEHMEDWLSDHPGALVFLEAQASARAGALKQIEASLVARSGADTEFDDATNTSVQGGSVDESDPNDASIWPHGASES
jgi:hypothetical protein